MNPEIVRLNLLYPMFYPVATGRIRIEMQFIGLKCLKLFPIDEEYTCEKLDSTMLIKDDCIYWCDCGDVSENDFVDYEGTFVCASKLRWRSIENRMGQDDFYVAAK